MPMTEASKKDKIILKKILYIYYLLCFSKDKENKIWVLIDSSSKANAMTSGYTMKIGLKIYFTNVKTQKIYDSTFKIFKMILASF